MHDKLLRMHQLKNIFFFYFHFIKLNFLTLIHPSNLIEKKKIKSLKFSVILLIIIWSVKLFEIVFDYDFTEYGVLPRNFNGLIGILFSPLIHSDVNHLLSNSLPVIILCLLIFNFYSQIAKNIHISLLYFRLMALVYWKRILSHRCKWFNLRHGKLFIFQWDFKKKLSIKCGRIVSNFHLRWTIWGFFQYIKTYHGKVI